MGISGLARQLWYGGDFKSTLTLPPPPPPQPPQRYKMPPAYFKDRESFLQFWDVIKSTTWVFVDEITWSSGGVEGHTGEDLIDKIPLPANELKITARDSEQEISYEITFYASGIGNSPKGHVSFAVFNSPAQQLDDVTVRELQVAVIRYAKIVSKVRSLKKHSIISPRPREKVYDIERDRKIRLQSWAFGVSGGVLSYIAIQLLRPLFGWG